MFVADSVRKGDLLVLCDGSPYPFALRQIAEEHSLADQEKKFIFLGPAPLVAFDGLRYGKAMWRSELDQYVEDGLAREFVLGLSKDLIPVHCSVRLHVKKILSAGNSVELIAFTHFSSAHRI